MLVSFPFYLLYRVHPERQLWPLRNTNWTRRTVTSLRLSIQVIMEEFTPYNRRTHECECFLFMREMSFNVIGNLNVWGQLWLYRTKTLGHMGGVLTSTVIQNGTSWSWKQYLGQKVSTSLRKTVPLSKVYRKRKAVRELANHLPDWLILPIASDSMVAVAKQTLRIA